MSLSDPALLDHLNQVPDATQVDVQVKTVKGPLFTLGQVNISGLHRALRRGRASGPGRRAADPILGATGLMTSTLRNAGYAFANVSDPYAVANQTTHTLDVSYTVTPGPRVDIGPVSFTGLTRTDPDFLRRHIELRPGQPYSDTALQTARDSLLGLGVFSSVTPVPAVTARPSGPSFSCWSRSATPLP